MRFPPHRLVLVTILCACGAEKPAPVPAEAPSEPPFAILSEDEDAARKLRPLLERGVSEVETFFGESFPESFAVEIFPDREAFTASFPPEWEMSETACWMVATGVADALRLLDPVAWKAEACEHDPDDAVHVQGIVTHELVHVFHGQHNPTGDFVGAEDIGWFLEGLAVLASGQLAQGHAESAREAVSSGAIPARLADAWSGPHRYGVSGTMVAFIDERVGRAALLDALQYTEQSELLELVGLDEEELLGAWTEYVAGSPR